MSVWMLLRGVWGSLWRHAGAYVGLVLVALCVWLAAWGVAWRAKAMRCLRDAAECRAEVMRLSVQVSNLGKQAESLAAYAAGSSRRYAQACTHALRVLHSPVKHSEGHANEAHSIPHDVRRVVDELNCVFGQAGSCRTPEGSSSGAPDMH